MSRLTIVPTPVGNLEDITARALRVLREASFVLAEDTRTTSNLFKHFNIDTKLVSYHKFNEHNVVDNIIRRIAAGEEVALVSDAGTPAISDPGYLIVRKCVEEGVEVQCLPGATAFVPALVSSGLPNDRFCFEGFLPHKKGRQTAIQNLADEQRTMIFYESPFRLTKTLEQLSEVFGAERRACVSREISKIFEEHCRGTLQELITHFAETPPKGEIVICVEGAEKKKTKKNKYNNEEDTN
jgi:16S rRNA (cytidine1402-2'-O)-methyltransferase